MAENLAATARIELISPTKSILQRILIDLLIDR